MNRRAARRDQLLEDLRHAVLDGPAATDPALRQAAAAGAPVEPALDAYLGKVRDGSYRVVDADVDGLRAGGHSEEEIFELTVAAALGKALALHTQAVRWLAP